MIPHSRRSNGMRFALHLLLPLAGLGVSSAATATTWSDAEFLPGDWEASAASTGGPASFSATRQTTDGNPAAHRVVTQTTSASAIRVFHRRVDATWDPAVDGGIGRIDATIDCRTIADNYPAGGQSATAVAVRQDGVIYVAIAFVSGSPPQIWSMHPTADLTEADFVEWLTLSGNPDFSPGGSPLEFGFMTSNNTPPAPPRVTVVGYDNWSVTVTPDAAVAVTPQWSSGTWGRIKSRFRE